jgi:hypothetical protein
MNRPSYPYTDESAVRWMYLELKDRPTLEATLRARASCDGLSQAQLAKASHVLPLGYRMVDGLDREGQKIRRKQVVLGEVSPAVSERWLS